MSTQTGCDYCRISSPCNESWLFLSPEDKSQRSVGFYPAWRAVIYPVLLPDHRYTQVLDGCGQPSCQSSYSSVIHLLCFVLSTRLKPRDMVPVHSTGCLSMASYSSRTPYCYNHFLLNMIFRKLFSVWSLWRFQLPNNRMFQNRVLFGRHL